MMWTLLALACSVAAGDEAGTKTADPVPVTAPEPVDDPWGDLLNEVKDLPELKPAEPIAELEEATQPTPEEQ